MYQTHRIVYFFTNNDTHGIKFVVYIEYKNSIKLESYYTRFRFLSPQTKVKFSTKPWSEKTTLLSIELKAITPHILGPNKISTETLYILEINTSKLYFHKQKL